MRHVTVLSVFSARRPGVRRSLCGGDRVVRRTHRCLGMATTPKEQSGSDRCVCVRSINAPLRPRVCPPRVPPTQLAPHAHPRSQAYLRQHLRSCCGFFATCKLLQTFAKLFLSGSGCFFLEAGVFIRTWKRVCLYGQLRKQGRVCAVSTSRRIIRAENEVDGYRTGRP